MESAGGTCRLSGLSEELTFEQRSEGRERGLMSRRKELQIEGTASAKALRWEYAWHVGETVRIPIWLEQSE